MSLWKLDDTVSEISEADKVAVDAILAEYVGAKWNLDTAAIIDYRLREAKLSLVVVKGFEEDTRTLILGKPISEE